MFVENSEAQLLIDKGTEYHLDCIRKLRSQRKALSPISKLPPDILITIFYLLSAKETKHSLPLPCYYFTHVSRSWRSIALDTPTLWQVLPMSSTPWTTAFLERSKAASLTVGLPSYFSGVVSRIACLKHVLANHASQIRHLDVVETKQPCLASLFENVQPSSLRLHSLKLTCSDLGAFTFPIGIIDTQGLRTLEVHRYDVSWYSLLFPALTSLKLYHIPIQLCLPKFLDMLRALPALMTLDMDNSLPSADNVTSGSVLPVTLPNLHYLGLATDSDPREVSNVLSSIIVPQTAILYILATDFVVTESQDVILGEFTSSLSKCWPAEHAAFYRNLHISSVRYSNLHLQAWRDDGCTSGVPNLNLGLDLQPGEMATQDIIQKVFLSIPLFNITTLRLSLDPHPLDSLLQTTLGRLPYLQTISIDGNGTACLIDALAYKPENYNMDASAYYSVTFPALCSLSIQDFLFDVVPDEFEELVDCLIERCERRAGLWHLKLTDCHYVCLEDVERLRELVVNVEWNGP